MNPESIETFLSLVNTKNITKTAELLFLSQSSISTRLANLEEQYKIKLFERKPGYRELTLTQRGKDFVNFAIQYRDLTTRVESWAGSNQNISMKIASIDSFNSCLLADFFIQMYQSEKYQLVTETHWTDRIFSLIENRTADLGIVPKLFNSKRTMQVPLFEEKMYLIYNSQVSEYTQEVDIEKLEESREIYFDWGPEHVQWHNETFYGAPKMETDNSKVLVNSLSIPNTWGIAPASVIKKYCESAQLSVSTLHPQPPSRFAYALYFKEQDSIRLSEITTLIQEFKQYIRESTTDESITVYSE